MEILAIQIPWFDILWISIGAIFILIGLVGCIVPVIPGPPLSYFGLLMLQLKDNPPFTLQIMLWLALIVAFITVIDYVLPLWGGKKFGSSKYGLWFSMAGLLLGIFFFPPIGIILGTVLGAFIGELVAGKKGILAMKATFGVVLGFLFGTILKILVSGYILWLFVINIV